MPPLPCRFTKASKSDLFSGCKKLDLTALSPREMSPQGRRVQVRKHGSGSRLMDLLPASDPSGRPAQHGQPYTPEPLAQRLWQGLMAANPGRQVVRHGIALRNLALCRAPFPYLCATEHEPHYAILCRPMHGISPNKEGPSQKSTVLTPEIESTLVRTPGVADSNKSTGSHPLLLYLV
jgi:hypothetical protein